MKLETFISEAAAWSNTRVLFQDIKSCDLTWPVHPSWRDRAAAGHPRSQWVQTAGGTAAVTPESSGQDTPRWPWSHREQWTHCCWTAGEAGEGWGVRGGGEGEMRQRIRKSGEDLIKSLFLFVHTISFEEDNQCLYSLPCWFDYILLNKNPSGSPGHPLLGTGYSRHTMSLGSLLHSSRI